MLEFDTFASSLVNALYTFCTFFINLFIYRLIGTSVKESAQCNVFDNLKNTLRKATVKTTSHTTESGVSCVTVGRRVLVLSVVFPRGNSQTGRDEGRPPRGSLCTL